MKKNTKNRLKIVQSSSQREKAETTKKHSNTSDRDDR